MLASEKWDDLEQILWVLGNLTAQISEPICVFTQQLGLVKRINDLMNKEYVPTTLISSSVWILANLIRGNRVEQEDMPKVVNIFQVCLSTSAEPPEYNQELIIALRSLSKCHDQQLVLPLCTDKMLSKLLHL
jgi:hypothetical protein